MAKEWRLPDDWEPTERSLFRDLVDNDASIGNDLKLQFLFDQAMFDPSAAPDVSNEAYMNLVSYVWTEYDIDFDAVFDWEDYREWYDATYS